jgi:hypothetical protein
MLIPIQMNMNKTKPGFSGQLKILYSALAAGQLIFACLAYTLNKTGIWLAVPDKNLTLALTIALSIVSISGISMSYFLYRLKTTAAKQKDTLAAKLTEYRIACTLRWALLEFPAFLSIAAFLFSGELLFFTGFGIVFLIFSAARPSPEKIALELDLSFDEMQGLENPS